MSWGDVSQEEKGHVMYPSIEQAGNDFHVVEFRWLAVV